MDSSLGDFQFRQHGWVLFSLQNSVSNPHHLFQSKSEVVMFSTEPKLEDLVDLLNHLVERFRATKSRRVIDFIYLLTVINSISVVLVWS